MGFQVHISGLFIDRQLGEPVVLLKETDGERTLPIWIRMNEMFPLALALSGGAVRLPRPLAHDMIKTIAQNLHVHVQQAVICDIENHIYKARLHLASPEKTAILDARPSDAILLSLKFDAPIFAEDVVAEKQTQLIRAAGQTPESIQNRLQQFRPEDFVDTPIG